MNTRYRIVDVIPHSEPMSLLDDIEGFGEQSLDASVTIRPDSLFCESRGVPVWVGIEYMGQAVAAWAGVMAREAGKLVKIGFLVSCRRYEAPISYFPIGARLLVSVRQVTDNVTGLQVFDCKISLDGVEIQANLNVFMPENIAEYLEGI